MNADTPLREPPSPGLGADLQSRLASALVLIAIAIPGLLVHFFNRRHPAFALGFRWTLLTLFLLATILILGILAVCGIVK